MTKLAIDRVTRVFPPIGARPPVQALEPIDLTDAVVVEGTMPEERTVLSTLGTLGADIEEQGVRPPAIIVIGDVVAVARPDHYGRD